MGPDVLWFICNLYPHLSLCVWHGFFYFISRCKPQKRQLLWQQGGHPYDALSLSRGPRRFPAGCAAGWLFHEGQFEQTLTSRASSLFSALHATQFLHRPKKEVSPFCPTGSSAWGQVPPVFRKCHGGKSLLSEGFGAGAQQQRGPAGGGVHLNFAHFIYWAESWTQRLNHAFHTRLLQS